MMMRVLDNCKSVKQNCDAFGAFLRSWQFSTMSQEELFPIQNAKKLEYTNVNEPSVGERYICTCD